MGRDKGGSRQARQKGWHGHKLGCCHVCLRTIVKAHHVTDAIVGVVLLIYGGMVASEKDSPIEAEATLLTFGSVLFFSAAMGMLGFAYAACRRCGLVVSAYTAPLIALLEFTAAISVATESGRESFFDYLTENKDALFLDDRQIERIKEIISVFCIILFSFGAIEVCRFFILRKLRPEMLEHDKAKRQTGSLEEPLIRSSERGPRSSVV